MNTKRSFTWLLALAAIELLGLTASLQAGTRVLPFQGRLTDANGNSLADGSRVVQFKIYDAPVGGRAVWNGEVHNLTINSGLVSTLLGTKATFAGVDFNDPATTPDQVRQAVAAVTGAAPPVSELRGRSCRRSCRSSRRAAWVSP